jgi:tetratricopeptide (TPR) repeat protein
MAAQHLLGRAVELLTPGSPQRVAALPWFGIALYALSEFGAADEAWTEAIDSGEGDDATLAFFERAHVRGHNPTEGETVAGLEEAVRERLARLEPDASPLVYASGYHSLARLHFWLGRTDDQLESATRARDYARRSGVVSLEATAAAVMGSALMYGASPWPEYEEFARGLLAERDRLGRLAAGAIAGLAAAASYQGRHDESAQLFAQHMAELYERGDESAIRTNSQNRGYARELAGDLEGAERIHREGWDALGEIGERGYRSTDGALLALVLIDLGRRSEAEAILAEVEEIQTEDDWLTAAAIALVQARLATADGRHDEAIAAAQRAVELGNDGYVLLSPWWMMGLGRALAAAGRDDEAREALEEAMRLARVKGSTVLEAQARALLP